MDELSRRHRVTTSAADAGKAAEALTPVDHMAVVTELDTLYGQSLARSFQTALAARAGTSAHVHSFFYLRGIDGRTVDGGPQPPAGDGGTRAGLGGGDKATAAVAEAPEGLNQTDYLRRLASQLRELDRALRTRGQRLTAVGVLGTDVYDKLLILRALRDPLPGTVFFTTGVDARFGLRDEWPATHNLVIAADFGLTLHNAYQHNVPPFRDSSQTAVFAATLTAATADPGPGGDGLALFDMQSPQRYCPRLFEIGRTGPFDLTVGPTPAGPPPEPPANGPATRPEPDDEPYPYWTTDPLTPPPTGNDAPPLHPPRADVRFLATWQWAALFWWSAAATVLMVALAVFGVRPRRFDLSSVLRSPWVVTSVAVLASLLVTMAVARSGDWRAAEPYTFFQGISVWPAVVLRCAAAALAVYLVRRAWREAGKSNLSMQERFALSPAPADPKRVSDFWAGLSAMDRLSFRGWAVYRKAEGGTVKYVDEYDHVEDEPDAMSAADYECRVKPRPTDPQVDAHRLWWHFMVRYHPAARLVRMSVATVLCGLTLYFATRLCGEEVPPARGASYWWEVGSHWVSGGAALFLLFFALDGTYLNRRVIEFLGRHTTNWPAHAGASATPANRCGRHLVGTRPLLRLPAGGRDLGGPDGVHRRPVHRRADAGDRAGGVLPVPRPLPADRRPGVAVRRLGVVVGGNGVVRGVLPVGRRRGTRAPAGRRAGTPLGHRVHRGPHSGTRQNRRGLDRSRPTETH